MKKILAAVIAFTVVAIPQTRVNAENPANELKVASMPEDITVEDVYAYMWDQTVVTVSRREQKISEAPASVTVITAEDIKRSGVLNLHELFRRVAGMDVVGLTQTHPAMSVRGFNTALLSRTILLLLNGNPAYADVTMSPIWSLIPVTTQQIERIEIVRGPGSALWGANAYSGVINIITKSPQEFPTYQVRQSVGDLGLLYTNFIHAHTMDNFQYSVQFEHDQIYNVALNSDELSTRRNIYTLDLRYVTPKQRELSALFHYGHPRATMISSAFNMLDFSQYQQFLNLTYKVDKGTWIKIRHKSGKANNVREGVPFRVITVPPGDEKTISVELQTTKRIQDFGVLTYGAEYKFVTAFLVGPRRTQGLGSFFFQDDARLNKKLSLVFGARVDTHPQVKMAFSPRTSVMYTPLTNHTLRVTGATSYRRPSYGELYANSSIGVPFPPFSLPLKGYENIKAERIQSLEFGYIGKLPGRTKMTVTLFRNILDNFINQRLISGTLTFVNLNKATQNGAEVELEKVISKYLKGFMNYALNQTKNTSTGGDFEMSPKRKVNAGLGWMSESGLYGDLVFNFVDDTGQTIGGVFKKAEPYRNVDVNFGYRFNKKLEGLELGLNVQNVFNKKRKEHPAGDTVKRRVVGSVSYAF